MWACIVTPDISMGRQRRPRLLPLLSPDPAQKNLYDPRFRDKRR